MQRTKNELRRALCCARAEYAHALEIDRNIKIKVLDRNKFFAAGNDFRIFDPGNAERMDESDYACYLVAVQNMFAEMGYVDIPETGAWYAPKATALMQAEENLLDYVESLMKPEDAIMFFRSARRHHRHRIALLDVAMRME